MAVFLANNQGKTIEQNRKFMKSYGKCFLETACNPISGSTKKGEKILSFRQVYKSKIFMKLR